MEREHAAAQGSRLVAAAIRSRTPSCVSFSTTSVMPAFGSDSPVTILIARSATRRRISGQSPAWRASAHVTTSTTRTTLN